MQTLANRLKTVRQPAGWSHRAQQGCVERNARSVNKRKPGANAPGSSLETSTLMVSPFRREEPEVHCRGTLTAMASFSVHIGPGGSPIAPILALCVACSFDDGLGEGLRGFLR